MGLEENFICLALTGSSIDQKEELPYRLSGDRKTVLFHVLTPHKLDNKYHTDFKNHQGMFESDQTLLTRRSTAGIVRNNAISGAAWAIKLGAAMVKMGSIDALTGRQGEIKKNCRVVN
ncbi:hypothetical protein FF1_033233 [Malus domestica]